MQKIVIISLMFLSSCVQLINGQQQPIIEINLKEKIYFTTCSGAVEDWGSCNLKANKTCPQGYEVLKRFESAVGGRREFTFQCKNNRQSKLEL